MPDPVAHRDVEVRGVDLDAATRCAHYHTPLDIVAIKMRCCDTYYACRECHDELAGHIAQVWTVSERAQLAVYCGACRTELSIAEYLANGDSCPRCGARFNPGCRAHHGRYFG